MSSETHSTYDTESASSQVGLRPIVEGEFAPTDFAVAPGDRERKYVLDQSGRVLVIEDGDIREEPFLDIRDRVVDLKWGHDERGLLGIAFHPDYEENRRVVLVVEDATGAPGKEMVEAAQTNYGMIAHETAEADDVVARLVDASSTVAAEGE